MDDTEFKIKGAKVSGAFGTQSSERPAIMFYFTPFLNEQNIDRKLDMANRFIDGGNTVRWRIARNTAMGLMSISRELHDADGESLDSLAAEAKVILGELSTLMCELDAIHREVMDYAKVGGFKVDDDRWRCCYTLYLENGIRYDGLTVYIQANAVDDRHSTKPSIQLPLIESLKQTLEERAKERQEESEKNRINQFTRMAEKRSEVAKLAAQTRKANERLEGLKIQAEHKVW